MHFSRLSLGVFVLPGPAARSARAQISAPAGGSPPTEDVRLDPDRVSGKCTAFESQPAATAIGLTVWARQAGRRSAPLA